MELVYLWVDGYKNIQKQGFNFSPRFKCEFDGKNLTITKNEDYVRYFKTVWNKRIRICKGA